MSEGKQSVTAERMPLREVTLSCGCKATFRNAPPMPGDYLICIRCGRNVKVTKRSRKGIRK